MTGAGEVLDAEVWTRTLADQARSVLGQLYEIPGSWFTLPVAAAAADLPGLQVLRPLSALAAAGLLRQDGARYRLLGAAVREGERDTAAAARIASWYLHTAYNALAASGHGLVLAQLPVAGLEPGVTPGAVDDFAAVWMWLAEQRENAVAVLRAGVRRDQETSWQLAVILSALFALGNDQQLWPEVIDLGLDAARRAENTHAEAYLLEYAGKLYAQRGWTNRGAATQRRALALREVIDDRSGQMRSANALGLIAVRAQRHQAAAVWFQKATDLAEQLGDDRFAAVILHNRALMLLESGRAADAEPMIREARERLSRAGQGLYAATTLQYLARARLAAGDLAGGLQAAEQAVAEATSLGPAPFLAWALSQLADALAATGRRSQALEALREAAALYRGCGDQQRHAQTLERAAALYQHDGKSELAAVLRERAGDVRMHLRQDDDADELPEAPAGAGA
jgi:tetratricopeptide (TPR) repeat protein